MKNQQKNVRDHLERNIISETILENVKRTRVKQSALAAESDSDNET